MPTVDQFLDAPIKQSVDDFLDADTAPFSDQTIQRLQQSAQLDVSNKLYRQAQEESKAAAPGLLNLPLTALSTPLFHPKTSPEDLAFRERHPIIGGIEKGIVSLAEGFTSPIGVATLGIGALPAQAQRAVAAGFAAQMASQVPEVAGQLGEEFGKPTDQRDTQKIAALITEGVGTLGMVAAAGKKGIAEPIAERAGAIPTFQVPRPLATIQPAGETYAPEARQIQESRQPEYQRVEAQRLPAEAGGGNRPVGSPPSEVLPQPEPQTVAPVKTYGQQLAEEAAAFRQKEEQDFLRRQAGLAAKPMETLPALVKRVGRQKVEEMIGDWDSNAQLSPDGKSITTFADPRNKTGKVRASSKEFMSWVAEQAPKPTVAPEEPLPPREQPSLFVRVRGTKDIFPVQSLDDAARKYSLVRVKSGAGASGLPPMDLLDSTGKQIGRISYNGKIWDMENNLLYDPFREPVVESLPPEEQAAVQAELARTQEEAPAAEKPSPVGSLERLSELLLENSEKRGLGITEEQAFELAKSRATEGHRNVQEAYEQALEFVQQGRGAEETYTPEGFAVTQAERLRASILQGAKRFIVRYRKADNKMEIFDTANQRIESTATSRKSAEATAEKMNRYSADDPNYRPILTRTEPTPEPTPPPEPAAEMPVEKQPWQMNRKEFESYDKNNFATAEGRDRSEEWTKSGSDIRRGMVVAGALKDNLSVPREVLADYPDLAKQAATEPEAGKPILPFEPGMSIAKKEEILGPIARDKILAAPSFPKLLQAAKSAAKSIHGALREDWEQAAKEQPWDLLSAHSGIMNAKSARAKTLQSLANDVIREAGLPMEKPGMYRGQNYRIDWDKLREQIVSKSKHEAIQTASRELGGMPSTTAVGKAKPELGNSKVLSTAASVQINAPEGATYLQITQKGGGVAREPIAKLQKSNTFRGVDIAKVSAGHIGKGGKFIEDTGPLTVREPISVGPGAETAGESKYSAIQQLLDQLNAVPSTGLPEKITARERIADAWAKGKSATDAAIARMQSISQSLKDTARGVRDVTDLDRRVGSLDWALQQSAAMSKRTKLSIKADTKDQVTRDAVAIWNDTPGTDIEKIAAIQDTLANLPANIPNRIRRALQKATNLDAKARDLSESLRQYYGIRLNDAQEAAIFENGLQDYYTHIWKKESNMPDDLRAALSNGRVSTYFEFARKRKFGTFLDGIRSGKVPELDPADVIPIYNFSLDRAIASRQFIRDVSEMVDTDGRPTLSPAGRSVPVEKGGTPDKLIIKPKARSEENADYQIINHPALRKWKWAGTDENGNPILYQSDLLVHPNSYQRLSRMMDRSRLTPSPMVRALLSVSTEVKGFKLGLLSAFHAIHTGSHALFHWTNPFRAGRIPIDWESPNTRFAVEKGHLKLAPDPGELKIVSEGIVPGRLVEKIPILGPWSRVWSEFQFGELIPRWKLATFENAYKRNLWARDNLPGSGLKGLTDEQIAARVGDSVNNAFGELNKLFLGKFGRSPEMQRMLRGIFLAPDFGEARLRFVEKALTKSGFEERLAIATMFLTLYTGARVANYLSHGDPEMDWKKAFGVKFGDHWWSMRSVVGDLDHLFADFGRFMYVRLNPVYARTASDMLFGRDVSGRKLTSWQKFVSRPLDQLIPIQFGALTRDDQKIWESFVTAMGVQTQRDSPTRDLRQIIGNWKKASTNPKIRADWERSQQELFAPSPYEPLRNALRLDNPERAVAEYRKLREIRKPAEIDRAMQNKRPFTGSLQAERQFTAQMTPEQAVVYRDAVKEREELYRKYLAILHNEVQTSPRGVTAQDFQPSPMGE